MYLMGHHHVSFAIQYGLTVQYAIQVLVKLVFHLKSLMDLLAMSVNRGIQTVLHATQLHVKVVLLLMN